MLTFKNRGSPLEFIVNILLIFRNIHILLSRTPNIHTYTYIIQVINNESFVIQIGLPINSNSVLLSVI